MADPVEVLQQAGRLRSGTRFERARAGATALSTFLQLSPDDKRELAVLVAQRVAPELVPRIQAETGIDLTQEQSRAVLDMIARLDGDDLDELTSSLATAEGRRSTVDAVAASAAAATGLDDVVAPATPPPAAARAGASPAPADGPRDRESAEVATLARRVTDLEARLAAAETTARTAEASLATAKAAAEAADARITELEAQLRDERSQADVRRRDHEAEVYELQQRLRRAMREARDADEAASTSGPPTSPTRDVGVVALPAARGPSAFASLPDFGAPFALDSAPELPTARRGGHADLVARLDGASAATALRLVTAALPRLATATAADRVRILQAIPDGWARRRSLQRMVEAGVAGAEDVAALGLLARTGDQVFAATSLLAAGVPGDHVLAQVSPAARQRLARRVA